MKHFTKADVNEYGHLYADRSELLIDEPAWMKAGLQQTATGYGKRLNSGLKIHYEGKLYRIYITQYSNAGTAWFTVRGNRILVN